MTRSRCRALLAVGALGCALTGGRYAAAQTVGSPFVTVAAGAFQFDLAGTGTAPMLAVRGALPLAALLLVEVGTLIARPEQQFGRRTTFLAPEVQIQVQWPLGAAAPYLGAGGGWSVDFRGGDGRATDLTVSAAGGVRIPVTERLGAQLELRVRGIGTGFEGSAAEWTAGFAWHP
jgi:hypothetical protein